MTERVYLQDAYLQECEAQVIAVEDRKQELIVQLSRTCLQPNHRDGGDKGTLIADDATTFPVLNVTLDPRRDAIEHRIRSRIPLAPQQIVRCKVDWKTRNRIMRKHTGNHLLYGCSKYLLKQGYTALSKTTLGDTYTKWIGQASQFTEAQIREVFDMANQIIQEGRAVIIEMLPREAALEKCGRYHEAILPRSAEEIRVVTIEGLDSDPCIGLHVLDVQEIGGLRLVKVEREGDDLKVFSDLVA